jgi:hypothetical protein
MMPRSIGDVSPSPAGIVRVHGDASLPSIVWPADELAARFTVDHPSNCDGGHRSPCDCAAWERQSEQVFARANGLTIHRGDRPSRFGTLDFARGVLPLVDHPVLLRAPHTRRIIAVISHDYNPNRDFAALGPSVVVDRLPRSWYCRGGDRTTAFLLRTTVTP